jgi:ubiquinol-cytochrome c reductase cytochrome b subunit
VSGGHGGRREPVEPGERTARFARRAFRAADARLPAAEGGNALLRKAFPDHWSFLLGELALYSFLVLLATGVYLTLFFHPGTAELVYHGRYVPLDGLRVSEAYDSTLHISFDVRGGLLIRQTHHWAADVFIASIGAHLLRIFFTGAFRRPRELNWMIGLTLFVLALLEGFCGYSLPDDLLSGTGLRTAEGILLSVPVVGSYLSFFAFGGQFPGDQLNERLYVAHILLLPGLLVGLLTAHLILVVFLKHTQWARRGHTNRNVVGKPMFPQFAASSAGLAAMVGGLLVVLGGLVQINPIWSYGPYVPDQVTTDSQPDWYVGFLEGGLRLMPGFETRLWGHTISWNVFVPTLVLPAVLFLALYAYPFAERWLSGDDREHHLCDRPRDRPVRTGLGVAGVTFYAVLLLGGGEDVTARIFHVSVEALVWAFRVLLVVAPVAGYLVARRLCLALQERDRRRLLEGEETGDVVQSVEGTFRPVHEPLSAGEAYPLVVREPPPPLPDGGRLRLALARWFHGARVEQPLGADERHAVAALTASPEHGEGG